MPFMSYSLSGFKGMQGTTAMGESGQTSRTALAASKECRLSRVESVMQRVSYSLSGFKGMQANTNGEGVHPWVVQP